MDTIVSIATAPGESAIGIVRMSGDHAINIAREIFRKKNGKNVESFKNRQFYYGDVSYKGQIIDEVLLVVMYGPKSFTCEDIVEIHCHGGQVSIQRLLQALLESGARMSERGEFTKRAFLNGRLDLSQAESILDLIQAKTPKGFDIAFKQMGGSLSAPVKECISILMKMMAHLEVSIDYPEEDIEEITYSEIETAIGMTLVQLEKLLSTEQAGRIIRQGLNVAIIGKPNVGKSSLLNALLKENRAIVTDVPGTTRDVIEEYINLRGVPVKLIDTAGIRETDDVVEKIGVERSRISFNAADLVIFVLNAAEGITNEDLEIMPFLKDKPCIILVNKIDLVDQTDYALLEQEIPNEIVIKASVSQDKGIDALEGAIFDLACGGELSQDEIYITNTRHKAAVESAYKALRDAQRGVNDMVPYDYLQVDIKEAIDQLSLIIGDSIEGDLLDQIFSQFCIGK